MKVDCVFARNDISDGGSLGLPRGLLGLGRHFWIRSIYFADDPIQDSILDNATYCVMCRNLSLKFVSVISKMRDRNFRIGGVDANI